MIDRTERLDLITQRMMNDVVSEVIYQLNNADLDWNVNEDHVANVVVRRITSLTFTERNTWMMGTLIDSLVEAFITQGA